MSRRAWSWLTALIAAGVIALVLMLQHGRSSSSVPPNVVETEDSVDGPAAGADGSGRGTAAGDQEPVAAGPADEEPEPPVGTPSRRAWLERAIRIAREERLAGGHSTGGGGGAAAEPAAGDGEPGTLDPEYIRSAVQELKPLIRECYELALDQQPDLEGRLVVDFEIVGEPDVGGVVETSEIDEASDLRHPALDECIRETMYTAELPAPEGGGRVTVRYPFNFSNAAE